MTETKCKYTFGCRADCTHPVNFKTLAQAADLDKVQQFLSDDLSAVRDILQDCVNDASSNEPFGPIYEEKPIAAAIARMVLEYFKYC